jgi:hypothetical protein
MLPPPAQTGGSMLRGAISGLAAGIQGRAEQAGGDVPPGVPRDESRRRRVARQVHGLPRTAEPASDFGADRDVRRAPAEDIPQVDLFRRAQTEDFIRFGFEPEFIGRLPVRVVLEKLDVADLFEILCSSEGSVVKQYAASFHGADLVLINKIDLLGALEFDLDQCRRHIARVAPRP